MIFAPCKAPLCCPQGHGFTCGIDDVLLSPGAESKRATILGGAEATVLRASAEAAGLTSLPVHAAYMIGQSRFVNVCVRHECRGRGK